MRSFSLSLLTILIGSFLNAKESPFSFETPNRIYIQSEKGESHAKHFQKYGYIWIRNFFSEEQVDLLRNFADQANESGKNILQMADATGMSVSEITKAIPNSLVIVPEANNSKQVCRTEDMLTVYPDLYHLIEGTVTSYLGNLLNEPYVLFKDKLNFKWPGGGAFDPHQDFPAFQPFGPEMFVTAMVSIDKATTQNGCLYMAKDWKKSFKKDTTINHTKLENGTAILPYVLGGEKHGSIQPQYAEQIQWLALHVEPGDLVIFDAFVPHYSEMNQSNTSRRAMFFTFNKLKEGNYRKAYYYTKRNDPDNPCFHFATPTKSREK